MLPTEPGSATRLDAGDLLVVPQGESHVIGSSIDLTPELLAPLLPVHGKTTPDEVITFAHGGGGAVTRMVCGFLAVQDIRKNPLLSALPRLFKVGMRGSGVRGSNHRCAFAAEGAASTLRQRHVLAKLRSSVRRGATLRRLAAPKTARDGWRDCAIARRSRSRADAARPSQPVDLDELAQQVGDRARRSPAFSRSCSRCPPSKLWPVACSSSAANCAPRSAALIVCHSSGTIRGRVQSRVQAEFGDLRDVAQER